MKATYTRRQGQVLAFIHCYTKVNKRAPAEADVARFFEITPPAAHQMIVTLEQRGFIKRTSGQPRSIRVLLAPDELPELE